MEDHGSRNSQKIDEDELNVISPRDIRDENNMEEEQSQDAEAELTMTDIEHGQTQLNDTEYNELLETEDQMTATKVRAQDQDEYETDNVT